MYSVFYDIRSERNGIGVFVAHCSTIIREEDSATGGTHGNWNCCYDIFGGNIILSEKVNHGKFVPGLCGLPNGWFVFHCFILVIITVYLEFVPIFLYFIPNFPLFL